MDRVERPAAPAPIERALRNGRERRSAATPGQIPGRKKAQALAAHMKTKWLQRSMHMKRHMITHSIMMMTVLILGGLICRAPAMAADDLKGWEKDSEYNKLYNASELDSFKGTVDSIQDVTPMPGMAPGVMLTVEDQDGDKVKVHLGPKSFVKVDSIGLKKGDKVKVRGCWATMKTPGADEVFMASKVKKSETVELKVRRTKDGVPFWTMTPEELAKEKEEQ